MLFKTKTREIEARIFFDERQKVEVKTSNTKMGQMMYFIEDDFD